MRVVFAGTPEPAIPSLERLIGSARHDVVAVVTRPDAAAGRGRKLGRSPVAALADRHDIPVLTPVRPSAESSKFSSTKVTNLRTKKIRRSCRF